MPQNTVVLFNRDRFKRFQATLFHSVCCKNECICTYAENKNMGRASGPIRQERSFSILPRSYSEALPASVLEIPQVKVAMSGDNPQLEHANWMANVTHIPGNEG